MSLIIHECWGNELGVARAVLREKRLPFDVTTESDPFDSDSNLAPLRRGIAALNNGKGIEHDIVDVSE